MHITRLGLILPAALVVAATVAAPAPAAVVSAQTELASRDDIFPTSFDLQVRDAASERNDLVISGPGDSTIVRVRDTGAALKAGRGCVSVSSREVTCRVDRRADRYANLEEALEVSFVVEAGGGDDRVRLAPYAGGVNEVFGGEGADVLEGSAGQDFLKGGAGRDRLVGGPGSDILDGDGANTSKQDAPVAAAAADEIDGGPDDDVSRSDEQGDVVYYSGRRMPVRVDLSDPAPDGAQDENDVLTGVESVAGGDGDDILIGDGRDNYLSGGPGRDQVEAGAGDDVVTQAEKVDLGAGDDRLGFIVPETGVGLPDATCGDGRDVVTLESFADVRPATDCEFAGLRGAREIGFLARVARGGLSVRLRNGGDSGQLVARVRRSGRFVEVGRARFGGFGSVDKPQTRSVIVRLDATGRRLAARSAGATFDVTMRLRQYTGVQGRLLVRVAPR